jgi:hypothetical protein
MKKYITAGMAIRRQIRRLLLAEDIKFTEDKGLFDSVFYFDKEKEFILVVEYLKKNYPQLIG